MKQKTIKDKVPFDGIGIHSGEKNKIILHPAKENNGIVFLKENRKIKAVAENVLETSYGTNLDGINVVEHLLAALSGLEIDNVLIEVFGNEIPVLDGSAAVFVQRIKEAGFVELPAERDFIILKTPIKIDSKESSIEALPYDGFVVDFMIDFEIIGQQRFAFDKDKMSFEKELAKARTFGFVSGLEDFKKRGWARGASLENALAISEKGYLNTPRYPDEPVRHKILDVIGDISLVGHPLKAKIVAKKSGHSANIELARRIIKTQSRP